MGFTKPETRDKHMIACDGERGHVEVTLPPPGTRQTFTKFRCQVKAPDMIIYDTEAYQKEITEVQEGRTIKKTRHLVSSAAAVLIDAEDNLVEMRVHQLTDENDQPMIRMANDIADMCKERKDRYINHEKFAPDIRKKQNKTREDKANLAKWYKDYKNASNCFLCHKPFETPCKLCKDKHEEMRRQRDKVIEDAIKDGKFPERKDESAKKYKQMKDKYLTDNKHTFDYTRCEQCKNINMDNYKVWDHDHTTGKYRGACHRSCNLNCRFDERTRIPVYAHNAEGYDHKHLLDAIFKSNLQGEVKNILARSSEKFMSISSNDCEFKDSLKLTMASVAQLFYNLICYKMALA